MTDKPDRSLTQEVVRELLDYDPETGVLTWRERDRKWVKTEGTFSMFNAIFAGMPAGNYDGRYIRLRVLGRSYLAHRLIWLWMTGSWPEHQIDHENQVRDDNRWSNLREATSPENMKNLPIRSDNTSGFAGVCWSRQRSKWHAKISVSGRRLNLGFFTEKTEAIAARKAAERLHGFHPNHGRIAA